MCIRDSADIFVKKHVLKDRKSYNQPTIGMTNLSNHYASQFKIEKERHEINVPDGFFQKLEIGPTFYTEFGMRRAFESSSPDKWLVDRPIDVHARFGTTGVDWYKAMREQALATIEKLQSPNVSVSYTHLTLPTIYSV